jgi:hypothetical protein
VNLDTFLTLVDSERLDIVGEPTDVVIGVPIILDAAAVSKAIAEGTEVLGVDDVGLQNSHEKLEMAAVINQMTINPERLSRANNSVGVSLSPTPIPEFSAFA